MTKSSITAEITVDGELLTIELPISFLEFYKKETGHSNITKKGVTRFLNRLIELYQCRFNDCS